MLLTGDIVVYGAKPYVYLELDSQQGIAGLVAIRYTESGWVWKIEDDEDLILEFDSKACTVLSSMGVGLDNLCTAMGKYYTKHTLLDNAKFVADTAKQSVEDFEAKLFTCKPSELIATRKKWRLSQADLDKANRDVATEQKATEAVRKGLAKEFDSKRLSTVMQMSVDYDHKTLVKRLYDATDEKTYMLIMPENEATVRGYLYDKESDKLIVEEKGRYVEDRDAEVWVLPSDKENSLIKQATAKDNYLNCQTQVAVYETVLETNAIAVKTKKDKEISTYRLVYDEMKVKLELEREKLKNLEKILRDAE